MVEIAVSSALLLLISGLAMQGLQAANLFHKRMEAQSELDQAVISSLTHLSRDIASSNLDSLLLESDSDAISFLTPTNADGLVLTDPLTGSFRWQRAMSYYVLDKTLYRSALGLADFEESPVAPSVIGLNFAAISTAPDAKKRVITRGCTKLETILADDLGFEGTTTDGTSATYTGPNIVPVPDPAPRSSPRVLKVTIRLERKGDRQYAFTTQMSIVPRN